MHHSVRRLSTITTNTLRFSNCQSTILKRVLDIFVVEAPPPLFARPVVLDARPCRPSWSPRSLFFHLFLRLSSALDHLACGSLCFSFRHLPEHVFNLVRREPLTSSWVRAAAASELQGSKPPIRPLLLRLRSLSQSFLRVWVVQQVVSTTEQFQAF